MALGAGAQVCFYSDELFVQVCVYPNQISVPLMENSGLPKPPCGMLELTVESCSGLKSADLIGKGDPYVKMAIQKRGRITEHEPGDDDEPDKILFQAPSHRTCTKHNNKNPEFKEHFKARCCAHHCPSLGSWLRSR